jgi:hypothetical protein
MHILKIGESRSTGTGDKQLIACFQHAINCLQNINPPNPLKNYAHDLRDLLFRAPAKSSELAR